MAIGAFIRDRLGPFERPISQIYRSIFIDLTDFVSQIKNGIPNSENILELGCGEGAVIEQIVQVYPTAYVVGININPRIGLILTK